MQKKELQRSTQIEKWEKKKRNKAGRGRETKEGVGVDTKTVKKRDWRRWASAGMEREVWEWFCAERRGARLSRANTGKQRGRCPRQGALGEGTAAPGCKMWQIYFRPPAREPFPALNQVSGSGAKDRTAQAEAPPEVDSFDRRASWNLIFMLCAFAVCFNHIKNKSSGHIECLIVQNLCFPLLLLRRTTCLCAVSSFFWACYPWDDLIFGTRKNVIFCG